MINRFLTKTLLNVRILFDETELLSSLKTPWCKTVAGFSINANRTASIIPVFEEDYFIVTVKLQVNK